MKISAEEKTTILARLSEDDKIEFFMWEQRGFIPKDIYKLWYKNIYLETDHWKRIVAETAIRADGHCMICGQKNLPMNTHHNIYRLWREKPSDIVYLCYIHHSHNHDIFQAGLIQDFDEDMIRGELKKEVEKECFVDFENKLDDYCEKSSKKTDEFCNKMSTFWSKSFNDYRNDMQRKLNKQVEEERLKIMGNLLDMEITIPISKLF